MPTASGVTLSGNPSRVLPARYATITRHVVIFPAWAARMLEELGTSDRQASAVARELSLEQLNWSPAPGQWSVGQCLDHLLKANQVYLPPIARALDGRSHAPVQEIAPGVWPVVYPHADRSVDAAPARPRARKDRGGTECRSVGALTSSSGATTAVRDLVRRASACDVNRIRFVNPFVPLVRFTVGTGLGDRVETPAPAPAAGRTRQTISGLSRIDRSIYDRPGSCHPPAPFLRRKMT